MKIPPIEFSSPHCPCGNSKDGSILFMVMTTLATLTILAGTLFSVTATDVRMSGNYKNSIEAFHNADAGMRYVEDRIMAGIAAGTVHLRGQFAPVHISTPTGFDFDPVTQLTRLGDKKSYMYRVTGRSGNARSMVEATVQKTGGYPWALFGGDHVEIRMNSKILGGNVGSNGSINLFAMGTSIDGDATPGPGEAVTGNAAGVSGSTLPATELVTLDPIDASDLAYYEATNDNAAIPPVFISGRGLVVPANDSITLPAGTYYFSDVDIGHNAAFNTIGAVTIYVEDNVYIRQGSTSNNTDADLLRIYSTTTDIIHVMQSSEFHAHLYAPDARKIDLKADGGFYGSAITGGIVETKMNGDYYLEGESKAGSDWRVTSWKLVRY